MVQAEAKGHHVSKKPKKDPNERKRLIGSRQETIERVLTPAEMDDAHERLITLLGDKAGLEEEKKAAGAELAAKIKRAQADIVGTLEQLRRKRTKEEITVEEWLTAGNEIVKVNAATGEQLGARTARADELQEKLAIADAPKDAPAKSAADGEDDEPEENADLEDKLDHALAAGDFGDAQAAAQAH